MVLRLSLILVVMALAAASEAEQCRLNGAWKSDSARTLAAIADKSDPAALNTLSSDLFGHMIHEWTCTEMRAWFDDVKRPEPSPYTVVEIDADVMVVSFPDSEDVVLRITFEGECYKVPFDEERFEYFCPVERGDGAQQGAADGQRQAVTSLAFARAAPACLCRRAWSVHPIATPTVKNVWNPFAETARALIVPSPDIGAQYFRDVAAVANAGGPPDKAALVSVMATYGLVPAAP